MKSRIRRALALCLCLLLTLSLCACAERENGVVTLGVSDRGAGMLRDGKTAQEGFLAELAALLSERTGRAVRLVSLAPTDRAAALADGRVKLLLDAVKGESGGEELLYSSPYLRTRQIAVVTDELEGETLNMLAGRAVAVQRDSETAQLLAATPSIKNSFGSIAYVGDLYSALLDVMVSDFDAVLLPETSARWYIKRYGMALRPLEEPLDGSGTAYAVAAAPENEALLSLFEDALLSLAEDGSLAELADANFGALLCLTAEEMLKND